MPRGGGRGAGPIDESELWERYACTVLMLSAAAPPNESTPEAGCVVIAGCGAKRLLPVATPSHILTAWNPRSVRQPPSRNIAANQALRQRLCERQLWPIAVVGSSPDGSWREESFLVTGIGRAGAAELAAAFGQAAIFELTDDELVVLSCPDAEVRKRVPRVQPASG